MKKSNFFWMLEKEKVAKCGKVSKDDVWQMCLRFAVCKNCVSTQCVWVPKENGRFCFGGKCWINKFIVSRVCGWMKADTEKTSQKDQMSKMEKGDYRSFKVKRTKKNIAPKFLSNPTKKWNDCSWVSCTSSNRTKATHPPYKLTLPHTSSWW